MTDLEKLAKANRLAVLNSGVSQETANSALKAIAIRGRVTVSVEDKNGKRKPIGETVDLPDSFSTVFETSAPFTKAFSKAIPDWLRRLIIPT